MLTPCSLHAVSKHGLSTVEHGPNPAAKQAKYDA